mmetsp:Transcript_55265/g.103831  ORF Transcript_55265/g.103831 Transcript_55265/m.103831 type:complete len:221 (+) Transcript_55265:227-889(+)
MLCITPVNLCRHIAEHGVPAHVCVQNSKLIQHLQRAPSRDLSRCITASSLIRSSCINRIQAVQFKRARQNLGYGAGSITIYPFQKLHADTKATRAVVDLLEPVDVEVVAAVDGLLREVIAKRPTAFIAHGQVKKQHCWLRKTVCLELQRTMNWPLFNHRCIDVFAIAAPRGLDSLPCIRKDHEPQIGKAIDGKGRRNQRSSHACLKLGTEGIHAPLSPHA